MLEHSKRQLAEATSEEASLAEIFARASIISDLRENLIPDDKAIEVSDDHRRTSSEEWNRAVLCALAGIRAASSAGFRWTQTGTSRA